MNRMQPDRAGGSTSGARAGLYLALTVLALIIAVYLIFQLLGFVFKLLFFAAVLLIAVAGIRAWMSSRSEN
jgi:hypothetical protein